MNLDRLKNEAIDKWPSILERLGIDVGSGRHQNCPACGGKDRFRFDDKGEGMYYCNQCGPGDGFSLVQKVLNVDFKSAIKTVAEIVNHVERKPYQKEKSITPNYFRKILQNSDRIKEYDFSHNYLLGRGLKTLPSDVWSCRAVWEPETKKECLAMLSVFRLPDGEAVTLHRTFISSNYEKLPIENPKKVLPATKKMSGGCVRLFPLNGPVLGIAEGIENAIAVYEMLNIPCWAALSTALLEAWKPPSGVKNIFIVGDNDAHYAGQKAAYALAHRLSIEKYVVDDVFIPAVPGHDFLDYYLSKKK